MLQDSEVERALDAYQLGLPRLPLTGRSGELLGRGAGSSLEFQEYRQYIPGDDIRHVDWAAYARSDALMVRLYREEISPRTEILVDLSRSMNTGEGSKALLTRQLAALFALLSARTGGDPSILPITDRTPVLPMTIDALDDLYRMPFASRTNLAELLQKNLLPLKSRAIRIVISDFLFPHDPAALIRHLATGASALWVLQLLTDWEAAPTALGGRRIVDIETVAESDLLLDERAVAGYLERLGRLQSELLQTSSRVHATFVKLITDRGLWSLCRNPLTTAGLLRGA